jgi:tetratricopeptide (TPR) repeat protein
VPVGNTSFGLPLILLLAGGLATNAEAQSSLKRQADRLYSQAQELTVLGGPVLLDQALAKLDDALKLYAIAGDKSGSAYATQLQAFAMQNKGQFGKAADLYLDAATRHHDAGNKLAEGNSFYSAGQMEGKIGKIDEQVSLYRRSLAVFQELQDRGGQATLLDAIGDTESTANRLTEAVAAFKEEVDLRKQIQQPGSAAIVLTKLGNRYLSLKNFRESILAYGEALKIYKDTGQRADQAKLYQHLGDVAIEVEQYGQARQFYDTAADMFRDLGDTYSRANVVNAIGLLQYRQHQTADAITAYKEACQLYAGDVQRYRHDLGVCLWNLGLAHEEANNSADALETLKQSLGLLSVDKEPIRIANLNEHIGNVSAKLGDKDLAVRSYRLAVSTYRDAHDDESVARIESRLKSLTEKDL